MTHRRAPRARAPYGPWVTAEMLAQRAGPVHLSAATSCAQGTGGAKLPFARIVEALDLTPTATVLFALGAITS